MIYCNCQIFIMFRNNPRKVLGFLYGTITGANGWFKQGLNKSRNFFIKNY